MSRLRSGASYCSTSIGNRPIPRVGALALPMQSTSDWSRRSTFRSGPIFAEKNQLF